MFYLFQPRDYVFDSFKILRDIAGGTLTQAISPEEHDSKVLGGAQKISVN